MPWPRQRNPWPQSHSYGCARRHHHGRTASYPAAPVQIPASGTTAPGSHLGWWRQSARSARDAFLSFFATSRTRSSALLARIRLCVRGAFCSTVFPLASCLPSTDSPSPTPSARETLGSPLAVSGVSPFVPV